MMGYHKKAMLGEGNTTLFRKHAAQQRDSRGATGRNRSQKVPDLNESYS